jgi:2-methylcitrate dehydratase PrpD
MSVAGDLAAFLAGRRASDLPEAALDHAAMLIASTLASAAMGSRLESAAIMRELACERGGTPEASLWFDSGAKLPATEAAQVNAVMSDAAASDDSDLRNIVHAGTPLTATVLALGERSRIRGADILAAIVLGYEASGRIGEAVTPGLRERGFHGCVVAIFGAAVAAGRLLQLPAPQLAQAIALAATSIGGLMAAANTSVAREYHAGLATLLGLRAALAAGRGFRAEETVLETRRGFFEAYGGVDGAAGAAQALRDLGQSWDILTDMAIKLVPGGHPYHAFAEAAANAAREADIAPDQIDGIIVSRPGFTALTGPRHPTDLIGMAHSPAYFIAAGAADRAFSWAHAGAAKIADPVIHRLIDKVEIGAPPTEHVDRYRQGATVVIHTKDGRSVANTVFEPYGSAARGIAWRDVEQKYRALLPEAGLSEARIEASLALIRRLADADEVAPLIALLRV